MIIIDPITKEQFIQELSTKVNLNLDKKPISIIIDNSCNVTFDPDNNITTIIFQEEWLLKNIPIDVATNFYIGVVKELKSSVKVDGIIHNTILRPSNEFIRKYMVDEVLDGEFVLLPMSVLKDKDIDYETIFNVELETIESSPSSDVQDIIKEYENISQSNTKPLEKLMSHF